MRRQVGILRASCAPLIAAAALSSCASANDVGTVTEANNAIQGGQQESAFAAVGLVSSAAGGCTGTLISPSVVLTAAHCNGKNITFKTGTNASDFVNRPVDAVIAHDSRDLLLLHLARPIRDIRPIDINTTQLPAVGAICGAVGFGVYCPPGQPTSSGTKRSGTSRVEAADDSIVQVIWDTGIADHGDSGGPLICDNRIAAVVLNHTDGDCPIVHQRENYTTIDADWITNQVANFTSEPMASTVAWQPNRLDTFVRGVDGAVYHKAWDGAQWYEYENLGGYTTGTPEAVSWGPDRLDIFVRGSDLALYHKWWDGSQWGPSTTDWEYQGGVIASHPSVVSWGPNRLDVFAVGTDGALYHKAWDGAQWHEYENLGGEFMSSVKAVSWGPNRLDIFGVGMDNALYHKWWDGSQWGPSTTDWEYQGGTIVGAPTVASWGSNRLDVFVKGTDNALYHKAWDGAAWYPSATDYEYLGGDINGSPVVNAWGPNRLDIFVAGSDMALYHKWWDGSQWGPSATDYEFQGGFLTGSPTVVSWAANRLDLFVSGGDFSIYHKWWDGANWGPSVTDYENQGGVVSW